MKAVAAMLASTMLLAGCATILEGGTQPMTIRSVPDGARIVITNRAGDAIHAGTTPATLTLKRGAGYFRPEAYRVRVEKDGYAAQDLVVTGSVSGWYFGNILFGGLIGMLVVDPLTGAMYRLGPADVQATLKALDVQAAADAPSLTIVAADDLPDAAWAGAVRVR